MALKGFKDWTKELNDVERDFYVPKVISELQHHVGKKNAISNRIMCQTFEFRYGWKIPPARFRKMIEYIRIEGLLFGVCSSGNGYFIAESYDEGQISVESQHQRIAQQTMTVNALDYQLKQMFDVRIKH